MESLEFYESPKKYYFDIDLQLFSGEKTEKATPRKKEQAREKGQVLQSKEVNTALLLLCVLFTIKFSSQNMYNEISFFYKSIFQVYMKDIDDLYSVANIMKIVMDGMLVFLRVMAPVLIVTVVVAAVSSYAQVGFLFTFSSISMKFSKISPFSGFKRMFSTHSFVELIKNIIKLFVITYIVYIYIKGEINVIFTIIELEPMAIAVYVGDLAVNTAITICLVLLSLSGFDYFYQWWEYEKNLRMSKDDIKQEYKQTEGNPEIKQKIKQKQRQMSMNRMMKDIPKADVIITNPTHFAVAIKYDSTKGQAPIVIAKGQDYLAQRIKEIAKENRVEIVENKALARAIYSAVDIGEAIPEELYQAVAEILAFVYNLENKSAV